MASSIDTSSRDPAVSVNDANDRKSEYVSAWSMPTAAVFAQNSTVMSFSGIPRKFWFIAKLFLKDATPADASFSENFRDVMLCVDWVGGEDSLRSCPRPEESLTTERDDDDTPFGSSIFQ